MKNLSTTLFGLALVALLFTATKAESSTRVWVTITVTNNSETGDILEVNSDARTWTNATSASTIATNAAGGTNVSSVATNLFSAIIATPFSGPVTAQWLDTNVIRLVGTVDQTMAVVITGNWASQSSVTQTWPRTYTAIWPIDAMWVATNRTNQASDFGYALGAYSTNAFPATSTVASNLVNLTQPQVIDGGKSFTGTNRFYGPFYGTNMTLNNVTVTNGLIALGVGANSTAIGKTASALSNNTTALGMEASAGGQNATAVGYFATANDSNSVALGAATEASAYNAIAIGYNASASKDDAIAIGTSAGSDYINSIAIGNSASTTDSNQVVIGSSSHRILFPGELSAPTSTNTYLRGTNRIEDVSFPVQTISTLANGANSVALAGTNNTYIRFTGTLTANSSIDGVNGGRNGRVLLIENDTGYLLSFKHQSGLESTAGNRLLSPNQSDIAVTDDGWATLIYDATASRWKIANAFPTTVIATNYALASMTIHDVTNTYTLSATTWLTVTNWTTTELATNVTANLAAGTLTVSVGGYYEVSLYASLAGKDVGGDLYEISIGKGPSGTTDSHISSRGIATSTDMHHFGCASLLYLTNSEVVTFRIWSLAGDDVDVSEAQLNLEFERP